jgi:hypothetical protein
LATLENEKRALESDVNLKTEVVVQTSEEVKQLRAKFGKAGPSTIFMFFSSACSLQI